MTQQLGISRRLALLLPPVRRLYDELSAVWAKNEALERERTTRVVTLAETEIDSKHSEALLLVARAEAFEKTSQLTRLAQKMDEHTEWLAVITEEKKQLEAETESLAAQLAASKIQSNKISERYHAQLKQFLEQVEKNEALKADALRINETLLREQSEQQLNAARNSPELSEALKDLVEENKSLINLVLEYEARLPNATQVFQGLTGLMDKLGDTKSELAQLVNSSTQLVEKHLLGIGAVQEASMRSLLVRDDIVGRYFDSAEPGVEGLLAVGQTATANDRWLDLLEASLTGVLFEDKPVSAWSGGKFDVATRRIGRDWPEYALTMIGTARMRSLRSLCELIVKDQIEGDLVEAGVWRGGACIYMQGIMRAYGQSHRKVFVADSFAGLPEPDGATYPQDLGDTHSAYEELSVSRDQVEENFVRYGLLDDNVVFVEGWFKDTLHHIQSEKLALVRLDGDMYESTWQSLDALYHRIVPGGILIIDDYILKPCAQAVDEFRQQKGIDAKIHEVDGAAIWWRVPVQE